MNDLKLPNSLLLPIPYLLQDYSVEELQNFKDEHGFGLLDWAICQGTIERVEELLEASLTFKQHTESNVIPAQMMKGLNKEFTVFFSKGGLTPIHLLVYLYKQYSESHTKGGFILEQYKQRLVELFKKLNNEDLSLKDYSQLSVTDYCFILESVELIEIVKEKDPSFSSLSQIKTHTAYNILSNYKKYKNTKDKYNLTPLLNVLKLRLDKENLENTLPEKNKTNRNLEKI